MKIVKHLAGAALVVLAFCGTTGAASEDEQQSMSEWDRRIAEVQPLSRDTAVGQYATFGAFEQDGPGSDGREPIVWLVADKKDSKALLVSRYVLDILPFNEKYAVADWEHSTIRAWLAHYFFNEAFNSREKARIVLTESSNLSEDAGINSSQRPTRDFVFLLSAEEAKRYLNDLDHMKSAPTPDASQDSGIGKSACGAECDTSEGLKSLPWWTRTRGAWSKSCAAIDADGSINKKGYMVMTADEIGVRPAIWVTIE